MNEDKEFRYLVKITGTEKDGGLCKWMPSPLYLAHDYRRTKIWTPPAIFKTSQEAEEAIKQEKQHLTDEYDHYQQDLESVITTGMEKRYPGLVGFMWRNCNDLCFKKDQLEFAVVKLSLNKLTELLDMSCLLI